MTAPALWIVAGLLCAAAEMLAPGVFLLPLGAAAVVAGALTAAFGLGWEAQWAAFAVCVAALVGAAIALRRSRPAAADLVNGPHANLIGATCRALAFDGTEGRVALGDGEWLARSTRTPAAGETLRVIGLEGTTLLVQ